MPRRSLVLALLVTCLAAWQPASALSTRAASWSSPARVAFTSGNEEAPRLAVDAAGDAVAIWRELGTPYRIRFAARPSGGAWGRAVTLASGSAESDVPGPRIVTDARGDVGAIWEIGDIDGCASECVEAAWRPAGGGWQLANLSSSDEVFASDPDVAIEPDGTLTAAWRSSRYGVMVASKQPSGSWTDPYPVMGGTDPAIGVNKHGEAVLVTVDESLHAVFASTRSSEVGAWTSPLRVSSDQDGVEGTPAVAINDRGTALTAWVTSQNGAGVAESARFDGGAWVPGVVINDPLTTVSGGAQVALTPGGAGFAAWTRDSVAGQLVMVARQQPNGTWGSASRVGNSGLLGPDGQGVAMTLGESGDLVVAWDHISSGDRQSVQSAFLPSGGSWEAATTVSSRNVPSSLDPDVGIDEAGDAICLFDTWRPHQSRASAIVAADRVHE